MNGVDDGVDGGVVVHVGGADDVVAVRWILDGNNVFYSTKMIDNVKDLGRV